MQNVSSELFTLFCAPLSPTDLLTLSQVCRKFREYLCAPNSISTQQIWKKSRLRFMPGEDMPPPEGMSEEKYISLLMTERGCQFCNCKGHKIYWEFEVRCCYECFSKKTIRFRRSDFPFKYPDYPQLFLDIMPYIYRYTYIDDKKYWKEQIEIAYSQYKGLSNENLQSWLDDKKRISNSLMKYAEQRKFKEEAIQRKLRFEEEIRCRELFLFSPPPLSHPPLPSYLPSRLFISFSSNSKPKSNFVEVNDRLDTTLEMKMKHDWMMAQNSIRIENMKLIQFHIQRLENYEQENIRKSDELKRNNFIETKRKKNKKGYLYSKHDEFHMKGKKGKNARNKFAY